ncbi:sigma-70 family RNA polymerase sigma factor [Sutcliffiella halmapala]|uniref:sigma-70 family RNA polymerase sigma factor n=1 Tax=Sutcliffiella halmapala TaxID=79882 RepID=UPI000995C040|nr:sigma-70 family RNA polymerase sigma factor [Sutcliffiella halmapala]
MSDVEMIDDLPIRTKSDKQLLNEIMIDYGQSIQQLVYTYVKDYAMAEDLTQEIFLKCYKKLHTFKQQSSIKTWVYRIAMNHCKDYLKSWHYRYFVLDEEKIDNAESNEKDVDQLVIKRSEEHRLVQALLHLPLIYREVVYLYYYEELTTKEISQMTKENENTIKTRLNRARLMIKKRIGEEDL